MPSPQITPTAGSPGFTSALRPLNSDVYAEHPECWVAGLRLVQKSKRCGKPNCDKCPHPGYWYLFLSNGARAEGSGQDVYVGREWNERTLLDLAAKISPAYRAAFERTINASILHHRIGLRETERTQRRAELPKLKKELAADVAQEKKRHADALKVEDKRHTAALGNLQKAFDAASAANARRTAELDKELASLTRELASLEKLGGTQ